MCINYFGSIWWCQEYLPHLKGAFSVLWYPLHSSMTERMLNHFLLLYIHKELTDLILVTMSFDISSLSCLINVVWSFIIYIHILSVTIGTNTIVAPKWPQKLSKFSWGRKRACPHTHLDPHSSVYLHIRLIVQTMNPSLFDSCIHLWHIYTEWDCFLFLHRLMYKNKCWSLLYTWMVITGYLDR